MILNEIRLNSWTIDCWLIEAVCLAIGLKVFLFQDLLLKR